MLNVPTPLLISYVGFTLFLFYQRLHIKTFHGSSVIFPFVLNIFALAGMLFGLWFLIYYGYKISWLQAIFLFVLAFLVKIVWFAIEAKIGLRGLALFFSLAGFVGLPVCGYFMWVSLP